MHCMAMFEELIWVMLIDASSTKLSHAPPAYFYGTNQISLVQFIKICTCLQKSRKPGLDSHPGLLCCSASPMLPRSAEMVLLQKGVGMAHCRWASQGSCSVNVPTIARWGMGTKGLMCPPGSCWAASAAWPLPDHAMLGHKLSGCQTPSYLGVWWWRGI